VSFELRSVDRSKVYRSIVDQIVEGIRTGAFPPGTPLPPERILAEQLAVSRNSVREAIRVLEHAGVLDVRTGTGTFVADSSLSSAVVLRTRTALVGEHSPLDVVVARRALEPACAEHAAIARHDGDLELLTALHHGHERAVLEGSDPREVDIAFHVGVGTVSRNPVLVMLMQQLAAIMREPMWQRFTDRSRQKTGRPERNLEQHRMIFDAIARGDAEAARAAMLSHIADVEASVLAEAQAEDLDDP
jgi:GntR family transcriptional repressor for pyruvate dehydrogenase complex